MAQSNPAVLGPVESSVRPAVAVEHGSDEHLTLLGAPWHWNLLHGVDRADMLAFGRSCMEAERNLAQHELTQKRAEYADLQRAHQDQSRNMALALRKLEQTHTGMWRGDEKAGEVHGYTNGWGDCLAALKKMVGLRA